MIRVSPFHHIELAEPLLPMLERPPERDYMLRRLSEKSVNGQPLIQGELVIAGAETLKDYPLARDYPVHFRKTYYPICFHQNPAREYENHLAASALIAVPPPIGSTRTTFRSCFLPGVPYSRLSPFGLEPEARNLEAAEAVDPAAAIGLWRLLEDVYGQVTRLHESGFAHGDLFLHNIIISKTPIGAHLIDFEQALRENSTADAGAWEAAKRADRQEILREAIFLQCALGRQTGPLAEASDAALPEFVEDVDRFLRTIARQALRA